MSWTFFFPSPQEKDKIGKLIDSLRPEELFCDDDFPADDTTLYNSDHEESSDIKWLRPKVRSSRDC